MTDTFSVGDILLIAVLVTTIAFGYEQWKIWIRQAEWRKRAKHESRL